MSASLPTATKSLPRNALSRRAIRVITRCSKLASSQQHFEAWLAVGASGQSHREHRAFAGLARHGHVPTHHACELAGDSEAEPRAAVAPRGERIGLGEILKQLRLLLSRHADAGIYGRPLSFPMARQ
jgi:hypothetical protein